MAAAPALLDELIEELLLRLPPAEPEILVHAALVCKPWYRIISDPRFRRRFREFHRAAPMLGFFCNLMDAQFIPTSSFRPPHAGNFRALDARHGRVLLDPWDDMDERFVVVWDPTTDERWEVPVPPPDVWDLLEESYATVLCAAAASPTCDHHDCHSKPFTLVFAGPGTEPEHEHTSFLHVYSSEGASWSEPIPVPRCCVDEVLTALVGSTLYFSIDCGSRTLSYNLATRQTSVIHLPPMPDECATALMGMENGGLGVAKLDKAAKLSVWSMEVNPNGDIGWTQIKVVELDKLLPVNACSISSEFLCYAQGVGVFFVGTYDGLFSFDLMSGKVRKVFEEPCDQIGVLGAFPCVVPYLFT
ncbi:uncharacterized protein [Miscanthus floridulus]|uniref:uncharacterized protein isoform X2 n=1 Tax=Miscanthus floridulus TaxID=154761 RepID=UPI00345A4E3F